MFWKIIILLNFAFCLFNTHHIYLTDECVDGLYGQFSKAIKAYKEKQKNINAGIQDLADAVKSIENRYKEDHDEKGAIYESDQG